MKKKSITLSEETIFKKIYLIRNQKVLPDADLAALYAVETRVLNRPSKGTRKDFLRILCSF